VHVVRPEGVAEYLIEQIRQLTHDVHLRPIQAPYKVYVVEDADRLRDAAANAFLKTLEEPPSDVLVVLLASDYDDILPTVASRCHVVRFAPVAVPTAVALVVERTGAGPEEALASLAASDGVIPRAIDFLHSPERRNARLSILGLLKRLSLMDGHDVLSAARELLTEVRAPLDELKALHSDAMTEAREYLARGAVTELEKRQKRELTAREREGVIEILSVTESWLRDCLVLTKGLTELIENTDVADATAEVASVLSIPAALRALDAVSVARARIAYNVSPQLAVEAMLFDIQEVLKCPR
jgi:DNA polymerase-3 subunit delta'